MERFRKCTPFQSVGTKLVKNIPNRQILHEKIAMRRRNPPCAISGSASLRTRLFPSPPRSLCALLVSRSYPPLLKKPSPAAKVGWGTSTTDDSQGGVLDKGGNGSACGLSLRYLPSTSFGSAVNGMKRSVESNCLSSRRLWNARTEINNTPHRIAVSIMMRYYYTRS